MSRQHELPGRKTIGYPTNRSAQFLRRKRVQRGNSNYRRAKFEHLESRDCLAFSLTITGTGLVFTGTKGNDTLWGIEYDTTPPAHDSIIFSSDGGPLASRRIKEVPKGFANSVTPISIDIVGYDGKDKVAFQDLGFPFLAGDLQGFPPASIAQISFYGMEGNDVMDTSTIPKNPAASPIVAVGIGGVPNIRFYGGPRFDELIGGILPEQWKRLAKGRTRPRPAVRRIGRRSHKWWQCIGL